MSDLSTLQRLFPRLDWEDRSEVGEFCGWLPEDLSFGDRPGDRWRAIWFIKSTTWFSDESGKRSPYPLYTVYFFGVQKEFLKIEEAIAWLRAICASLGFVATPELVTADF